MPRTVNKFEAVGRVESIARSPYGNVYITTSINQANGKTLHPDFCVSDPTIPINIPVGGLVYFRGHIRDRRVPGPNGKQLIDQIYYVDELSEARPSKDKHESDQFLNIKLQGKLERILDSGHGWKKIVISTTAEERGVPTICHVLIGYYASSETLIRVRDLDIGCTYEVKVHAVTPSRMKDGREIKYSNLEAFFSRLVPERTWFERTEPAEQETEKEEAAEVQFTEVSIAEPVTTESVAAEPVAADSSVQAEPEAAPATDTSMKPPSDWDDDADMF